MHRSTKAVSADIGRLVPGRRLGLARDISSSVTWILFEKEDKMHQDECVCGWVGESFEEHHFDTRFDERMHVETSPLMRRLGVVK